MVVTCVNECSHPTSLVRGNPLGQHGVSARYDRTLENQTTMKNHKNMKNSDKNKNIFCIEW